MSESDSRDSVGHSADLRTRIAAVIEAHDPCGLPGGIDCSCGQGFRPDNGSWVERGVEANRLWSEHLADVLIRELQLTVLGDGIVVGVIHE